MQIHLFEDLSNKWLNSGLSLLASALLAPAVHLLNDIRVSAKQILQKHYRKINSFSSLDIFNRKLNKEFLKLLVVILAYLQNFNETWEGKLFSLVTRIDVWLLSNVPEKFQIKELRVIDCLNDLLHWVSYRDRGWIHQIVFLWILWSPKHWRYASTWRPNILVRSPFLFHIFKPLLRRSQIIYSINGIILQKLHCLRINLCNIKFSH